MGVNIKRLILIFILSFSSYAEVIKISVEDAIRMALENSLESRDAEYREKIKKLYKDNSWNLLIPNLGFSSNFSRQNSFMPNVEGRGEWNLNFGVAADLSVSPSIVNNIRLTVFNYEAAKIDREKVIKNIRLNVLKMYNELLAFKSILEVLESQFENSKLKFEQVKISYHNGLISEIDYLDAKLKHIKFQPSLDEQIIKFEETKERFKLLLGLDVLQDFETTGELSDEILDISLFDEVINIDGYLEVRELNNLTKIMQTTLESLWLDAFLPRFSFSVSYNPGSISFSDGLSGSFKQGLHFSLGLTYSFTEVLPFSKSFTEIWERDYRLKFLENQIENKIREFKSNIIQKRKSVRLYKSILDNSKINLEMSKKNYQVAFDSFNVGTIDLIKLNDIEASYKQSDLQFIQDKLNYANAILEYKDLINKLD
ncbi:TolC family protein [Borrelia turicatae]|uniref:Outer membrane protein TolC n=1 Tax=Borrelia turicatae (strain 91E135) TaxID=314724 RepID=A0ABF7PUS9_BORT9|nr:TolC family protein [Borrelia turicatae]AAX17483.1 outer membrane protein TolC [Borrelia turicatae 91E135]UPA13015.1 TolC family protein [Borrelia turicatae 91E135]